MLFAKLIFMDINQVKTAIKIGDFIIHPNKSSRNHIKVDYDSNLPNDVKLDNSGRVYLFVVNGEIKKIGGSSSTGGIKSTLSFYECSMTGSPGKPRFILHLLIRDQLLKGNKVEVYMIQSKVVMAKVSGLFDMQNLEIAAFKEMEDRCRKDYFKIEGKHPDWNFKENNHSYPVNYSLEHVEYHKNRLKNK